MASVEALPPAEPPPDEPELSTLDGGRPWEWEVHPTQGEVLTSPVRFQVLPAGRRWGKSEVAVMWIALKAQQARLRGMKGVLWIVYPTYSIARVAWRKFRRLMPPGWVTEYVGTDLSPIAVRFGPNIHVEFKSGAAPGSLVGEGLIAVWIDECGEIKERVWLESIRPTLIDLRAAALLTGTPKGANWFQRMFARGLDPAFPDTKSYATSSNQGMPSYANPYISKEEIDELAREMSERLYQQEILATFLSDEGAVFKLERLRAKGLAFSTKPTQALGVDLARRADFTVLIGMDRDGAVTYFDRFKDIDWPIQKEKIAKTWAKLGKPATIMDATGVGDPVVQDLQLGGMMIEPFLFTGKSKVQLVERLAMACDAAEIRLPDEPVLLNELQAFDMTRMPSGYMRYAAPEGGYDDCVMALALAYWGVARYADIGFIGASALKDRKKT